MIIYFFCLLVGACVGSFLTVYSHRFIVSETQGSKESICSPRRSYCPECRSTIPWFDNIPLLSYLFLKARCRFCHKRIPLSYFIIELVCTIVVPFVYAIFHKNGILFFLIALLFVFFLIAIFVIDIKSFLIPDAISLGGLLIALCVALCFPDWHFIDNETPTLLRHWLSFQKALLGCVTGGFFSFLICYLGTLAFKKQALGGGDVKMMAMVCAFLGARSFFWIFFIGSLLGTAVSLPQIFGRKLRMSDEIPFGPYLAVASLIYLCQRNNLPKIFLEF